MPGRDDRTIPREGVGIAGGSWVGKVSAYGRATMNDVALDVKGSLA